MRPDLSDVVSGVQRLLQNELLPALPDPYLQEQAAYASLLLEYVKNAWAREHLAIAAEHADLGQALAAVAEALGGAGDPAAAELAAEARGALAAHAGNVAATPLDAVLSIDRQRREIAERAVALLDRLPPEIGQSPPAVAARRALDGYLVRAAARQESALQILGISW